MTANRRPQHNVLMLGSMNGMLAQVIPMLGAATGRVAMRSIWRAAVAEQVSIWPHELFHENVAFNSVFLNAGDLASPCATTLLTLAQRIAPTLVFCRASESASGGQALTGLVQATSPHNGHGVILSCYTGRDDPAALLACLFACGSDNEGRVRASAVGTRDPCYAAARALTLANGAVSLALVQRTLKLAYTRSAQLIDAMVGDILDRDPGNGDLFIRPDARMPAMLNRR